LLGLVGAGAGAGAALGASGASQQTAAQWVSGVIATTAAAGSAHLTYSHVVTSADPLLASRSSGSGVVDFTSGSFSVSEVDRQTSLSTDAQGLQPVAEHLRLLATALGPASYEGFEGLAPPGGSATFVRLPNRRNPHAELGLASALSAVTAVADLTGAQRIVAVNALGPATVGGVATTRYAVQTASACGAVPLLGRLAGTHASTQVWVDGSGRLVQATAVERISSRLVSEVFGTTSALGRLLSGSAVVTSTLRLTAFGAPVHISPPPSTRTVAPGGSESATATARCAT
jgi:hypothetical protein